MKVKQHLYIAEPAKFITGNHDCLMLFDHELVMSNNWLYCGEIELEIDFDAQKCRQIALNDLNRKESEARAAHDVLMQEIERRKNELLALEHTPQPASHLTPVA